MHREGTKGHAAHYGPRGNDGFRVILRKESAMTKRFEKAWLTQFPKWHYIYIP